MCCFNKVNLSVILLIHKRIIKRPKCSSAAIPESSWLLGRNWILLEDPILKRSCKAVSQLLVAHPLDTLGHQFHPFLAKMKMRHPLMGHLPPNRDVGRVMAFLHPQNAPLGTFEHKSCYFGCYTAPQWRKISHSWRGCFCACFQHATGGHALFLSIGSPSKQE